MKFNIFGKSFIVSLKGYSKLTPTVILKVSDSILAATSFISASSIIAQCPKIALMTLILGFFAKFTSNFFVEDKVHVIQ